MQEVLKNDFLEVSFSSIGATVCSIKIKDKNGDIRDVVLGYADENDYKKYDKYIGATVGRCANRIANAQFLLDGKLYELYKNDGENHLHGGKEGFNRKEFAVRKNENAVIYSYKSFDMEEGYPGNLNLDVTYTLNGASLIINYKAVSDADTICSITNHSYFNLGGDILEHELMINAEYFTENNEQSIPTGKILPVKNTPMDFTKFKKIGKDINSDYHQIRYAKGFDNNWVIKDYDGSIKKAAQALCDETGIKLEVYTDYPGIQFYSGNYLDGGGINKDGKTINNRSAFCLECQYFPDAMAHKNFTRPILSAGEIYDKTIEYRFSVL